jgi:hypothetical protein
MANPQKRPTIERVPAARAQGLDDDVTAQPRPIADEIALEVSSEPELSVDPEDLGARFLSDAVEQGDFNPDQAWPADSSLIEVPAGDHALGGTNFVAGNSVWEQTVDLENRTQGASDQLRQTAAEPSDDFDSRLDEDEDEDEGERDNSTHAPARIRVAESTREQSLLDREGDEGDDTIPPDVDMDEQGSHSRLGVGREPERVENSAGEREREREPIQSAMRPKAPLAAAARTVLDRGVGLLRRVADRLQRHGT